MQSPVELSYRQLRYNVRNYDFPFHTGHLDNGTHILIGVQRPDIVLVEFDAFGSCLKTLVREFSVKEFDADELHARLKEWQIEIGFTPDLISVKGFFLKERWIGIQDLPDHYQKVIDNPEEFDEERRQELQEDIRLWYDNGDFVLWWNEDYYFSQDGEMASS